MAPGVSAACLHAIVRALRRGQLRLGLQAVRLGGLHLRLGFGNLRRHFRSAQFGQQIALLHDTAAVHQHAIHIARHPGVQRDAQERQKLARQLDGSGHRFGHDRSQIARLRPASLARAGPRMIDREKESVSALHSIGSPGPSD